MTEILNGDCAEILKTFGNNSFDAIVSDPPAAIAFMNHHWDKDKGGRDNWITWMTGIAAECLRVVKPGGHALVWTLPRTAHWTATAWENGGWEIRDCLINIFGSGFPKSLNISRDIDRIKGAEREMIGKGQYANRGRKASGSQCDVGLSHNSVITAPATPEAEQYTGWGTGLKPAYENWFLLRKPISEKSIAANVLKWGTCGINIDGCRVNLSRYDKEEYIPKRCGWKDGINYSQSCGEISTVDFLQGVDRDVTHQVIKSEGRFPANVIHDGSEEVLDVFLNSKSHLPGNKKESSTTKTTYGEYNKRSLVGHTDSGSAARFFYCAKASKRDRDEGLEQLSPKTAGECTGGRQEGSAGLDSPRAGAGRNSGAKNHHPTVKSTKLMRYLCRLITPPNGIILDPFCGSGSTGKGAILEGFRFVGIEQDPEYCRIARHRIAHVDPTTEIDETELGDSTDKSSQPVQLSLF